jgi:hypothetical protein
MMKYVLSFCLMVVLNGVYSQNTVYPLVSHTDCSVVTINDVGNTPYLDRLLETYNINVGNYTLIDAMKQRDFTCVKSYIVMYNNGSPIIKYNKPKDTICYSIGWDKISIVNVEFFHESCGINMTTVYLFPRDN